MASKFNLKAKDHLQTPDSKKLYNLHHFTESAPRYDIATRMLSFGRDRAWKDELIKILPEASAPFCLDLACGTGDIAFGLAKKYPQGKILGLDLTEAMIEIAHKRNAQQKNESANVSFIAADMCVTGLEANSVDILTGSYAIRNAPHLDSALEEIYRVLKPGAIAAFLDFSKPSSKLGQKIQYGLLKFWGSFCGLILHGNPEVHGYISSSIRSFPDREQLKHTLERHGLQVVQSKKLYLGMLEITVVRKTQC